MKLSVISSLISTVSSVEVGQHFYWSIFGMQVHGQVLINSWIVIFIILVLGISTTRELKLVPGNGQSFIEFLTEFIRDIAKTQIGDCELNGLFVKMNLVLYYLK